MQSQQDMWHPTPGGILTIDGVPYKIPGAGAPMPGTRSNVYHLTPVEPVDEPGALKVFIEQDRLPQIDEQARLLRPLADIPGLTAARRAVITPIAHSKLLSQHPALAYAVLMPWIKGQAWSSVVRERWAVGREESRNLATQLAELLAQLEERGAAHCSVSGANLLLPGQQGPEELALIDLEHAYLPGLDRPALPLDPLAGYAHPASPEEWSPAADRFPGAVLIAELLGWQDARVRNASWGESYFDPNELGRDTERYGTLLAALRDTWGGPVAGLFEQAWHSTAPANAPALADWAGVLAGKSIPAAATAPAPSVDSGAAGVLVQQAERLVALGAFARAAEIYREALARMPEGDPQRPSLLAALADVERRQTEAPTPPPPPPPAEPEWTEASPPPPTADEAVAAGAAAGAAGAAGGGLPPGTYREWMEDRPAAPVPRTRQRSGISIWQIGLMLLAGILLLAAVVRIWSMAAAAPPPSVASPTRTRTATASPSATAQPTTSATALVPVPPTSTRPAATATATTTATRTSTATVAPTLTQTPAVTPTLPPLTSGRRIAYVSEQSGSPQIWLMNGDGGQKRQITSTGTNRSPSWSPDNRYIYYVSQRDGRNQIFRYVVSSGKEEAVLTQGGYSQPQLLSNGDLIYRQDTGGVYRLFIGKQEVFALNRPFIYHWSEKADAMLIEPEGDPRELLVLKGRSGKAAVVAPARSWNGTWGPNGELLYVSDREGVAFIYVAKSDGTEGRVVSPTDKWSQAPAWSPNGDWIAFVGADGQKPDWNLYVMSGDGQGRKQIGKATNPNKSPIWSPENTRILFESDRAGNWDIFGTTTDGAETRLTNNAANEYDPVWSY